jgi:release factor glutamine methyltransferase
VASRNAEKFRVADRIKFKQNDLLENINGKFDLIAANLPYIPSGILNALDVARFEPRLALDGGKDGMLFINKLLEQMQKNLLAGGCAFFEIQYNQLMIIEKAKLLYPNAVVTLLNDLASLPRVIKIQL